MIQDPLTDHSILEEIGERLAQRRIEIGLTQANLATQAGVGRATVERLEAGRSTQMASFVRILRVLGLLEGFLGLVPEPGPGPMDLLKKRSKVRQRASTRRRTGKTREAWTWDEDS
jgi:transcriptional regulator with XRE-family HTH domain